MSPRRTALATCLCAVLGAALATAGRAQEGGAARAEPGAAAAPPVEPAASTPAPAAPGRSWAVRRPSVDTVVFRGVVSYDAAGMGTGAMLYPAPNAAGLLAAILTHSLLNEGAKKSQRDRIQAEADAVLLTYQPVLAGLSNERLIRSALARVKTPGTRRLAAEDVTATDWSIETAPVYSMTRDQRAIVLDNAVRIYAPGRADAAAYAQTIRVVATPIPAPPSDAEIPAVWLAADGQRLAEESAMLLAESLEVAMAEATAAARPAEGPHRTFRYFEGGNEKMERAQLIEERCDRALIRTLRGWLMSIPVRTPDDAAGCSAAAAAR